MIPGTEYRVQYATCVKNLGVEKLPGKPSFFVVFKKLQRSIRAQLRGANNN